MNVILLEDLKGVGTKGALVHVKPGYARNYLLPRKLAIPAGNRAANLFQELERQRQVQDDKRIAQARAEDTLFGSVTNADVADALARAGHAVDKHQIELADHLKQLGRYDVTVSFAAGVTATIKVWVVRA